jgi:dTDP-4-amino-4,6-dideoxygalactose transaminase
VTQSKPSGDEHVPALDLRAQYATIADEIRAAIEEVLESQHFVMGPQGAALEQELARLCGARFGVGVASGTDALILALHACGVGPGDEVLVPAFTYVATADSAGLLGAKPVFVDILPGTFNLDPEQVEARITARTKAIVPVHLFGQPADMDPILEIARRRGLRVIEDNAQAIGAAYQGRPTGSMGDAGCLSFYPTKNLGAYGDGGMSVTNSGEMAARLRSLRMHGTRKHKYLSEEQGWNSRLDEIQAAVLRVKLRHLEGWTAARQARAARYSTLLSGVEGVTVPEVAPGREHVFHQYTIRVRNRDHVQRVLAERGIGTAVYYPLPLHLQPMYASLDNARGSFPVAERAADEVLSLPLYAELSPEHVERVADAVKAAVADK